MFDIKKFAIDDGPGIRTTIFLKGCSLRCWWCHNPEGQLCTPEIMFRQNRCIICKECITICPKHALLLDKAGKLSVDRDNCNLCGKCTQTCPTEAFTIIGKPHTTINEIMKEIEKDQIFYEESKGGITISGGEPLLQISFLNTLLTECKNRKIHTAVDTSGYASRKALDRIKDKTDLFLFDIKTMNEKKHTKYTGVSNKQILQNFKNLAQNGSNLLVRLPVVPGINDDQNNIAKTAEFMLSNDVNNVCLLPYYRAGIEKYRSLNRRYKLMKIPAPTEQKLKSIKQHFETLGLHVKIGG